MTGTDIKQQQLAEVLALAPVLPVVTLHDLSHAVPVARALVAGGIRGIEVALRTAVALDAIRRIVNEVEEAVVGAGTVVGGTQLKAAREAGARFAVSPGAPPQLLASADDDELPLLPGAATATEVMALAERGYRYLKFFPAVAAGGTKVLASWAKPLPTMRFCPTGGISPANAPDFLALPNVVCVGGSWLAAPGDLKPGNWARIERAAREAGTLRG